MDNIAYLHLASDYEGNESSDLVSLSYLFNQAAAPDWKRLSSRAWKYMLPLALTLSILGSISSVWALQRGDQGPSVRSLQQKLQQAGFYQAPISQVYDFPTEAAVRRFQEAAGLPVDGIVGTRTLERLDNWRASPVSSQPPKATVVNTFTTPQPTNNATTPPRQTNSASTQTRQNTVINTQRRSNVTAAVNNKRRSPNYLTKGDEGEDVRLLQERLRVAGFYFGNATGIFGPITEESVKRFQAAYKLNVDGIVGPATLKRLPPVGVGGETPAPKPTAIKDTLTIGDRGEAVRVLQEQLIKAGYLKGTPNGYFGSYTADAVKRFQGENYLAISGIAGPTTRARLHSLVSKTPKSDFNVLEIQRRLQARGFYKGQLNGVMAEDTRKAIKQAQEFYGISLNDIRSGRF
ncbi:putative peptidoglycan-binding domain-containing protein [Nostoc sp. PCC 7524]|uniref:peptidoglycan-binding domain-containing protein n=1 Tax=Nostoc sp. (strain ATCC 29411 / PCC 7524) TaxID=28072 RepID=UPI00029F49FA|nr:peptidoglycan-binding protein [Nostoc sp. PCC 7524]AFY46245.1 putative peptidoglycan-binding domain-containing protein [Nostoc sp. PCC 7524]